MKQNKLVLALLSVFFCVTLFQPVMSGAAAKEKVVLLGQTEPLSGPAASMGIPNKRMVELVVDKINNAGGFKVNDETYKFKVVCEDNKGTTEGGVAAANKLVYQDEVKLMVNFLTTPCLGTQVVTEPAKVINMLSGQHKDILGSKKPYSFRHFISPLETIPLQVKWILKNKPNIKSCWMNQSDDASGVANMEPWNAASQKYGIKVLGFDYVNRSVTDFYPLLAKIIAQNPGIIGGGGGDQFALLFKQAREKGYKGQFVMPQAASAAFVRLGGAANLEGMLHVGIDLRSDLTPPGIKEYYKLYIDKYGEDPGEWSAWQTAPPYIFAQALQKAGTVDDVDKIKKVLEKEWFDSPWGKVKFAGEKAYGMPHQMLHPVFISTVQDGKIKALERIDVQEIEKLLSE